MSINITGDSKEERLESVAEHFSMLKDCLNEVFNDYQNEYAEDELIMNLMDSLSAIDDALDMMYDVLDAQEV